MIHDVVVVSQRLSWKRLSAYEAGWGILGSEVGLLCVHKGQMAFKTQACMSARLF